MGAQALQIESNSFIDVFNPKKLQPIGPEHDPESRFLGTVHIRRIPHLFELLEIVLDEKRDPVPKHADYADMLDHHHLAADNCPLVIVDLFGRHYAILFEPSGQ